ncbi:bifunctional UDP-sugar hydrolase/5'-nucleotidase [Halalkalibacter kiskunsagensis]|uniref:Bifunctional UDP-sugar hydrolase/5'-nucleotidase n=1 Tax=Halalkalibacter kiskunsagensis TaxID=1548599 RepID=A0ABV6KB44_9BACI
MNIQCTWTSIRCLRLGILLLFVLGLFGCAALSESEQVSKNEQRDETISLKILHLNDIHASIGDFAYIATYIETERKKNDYFLHLNAGDLFSGDPVVDLQQGTPIIELLNKLELNAVTMGNHDFDYGQEHTAAAKDLSNFPWLSANTIVVDKTTPIQQPKPYVIFELEELTVGVLGLTQSPPSTAPASIEGLEFLDLKETIEKYSFLRDEVDVFIGLTHVGIQADRMIAKQYNLFDVIIGGHSHTVIENPETINHTAIAQAGANGLYIGDITIDIDRKSRKIVNIDGRLQSVEELQERDEEIQAMVEQYIDEMATTLQKVIGNTKTGLTRVGRNERDVPLGNFWTDAMRHMTGSDIALTNNGGIRNSIEPGEITSGDIYTVEPFQNDSVEFKMTGQAIKNVIEFSFKRGNQIDLQTSGLHYTIFTNDKGQYVDSLLEVDGKAIDLDETYHVITNSYLASGGDGYHFEGEVILPAAGNLANALIIYAEQIMKEKGSIDYEDEGRILIRRAE